MAAYRTHLNSVVSRDFGIGHHNLRDVEAQAGLSYVAVSCITERARSAAHATGELSCGPRGHLPSRVCRTLFRDISTQLFFMCVTYLKFIQDFVPSPKLRGVCCCNNAAPWLRPQACYALARICGHVITANSVLCDLHLPFQDRFSPPCPDDCPGNIQLVQSCSNKHFASHAFPACFAGMRRSQPHRQRATSGQQIQSPQVLGGANRPGRQVNGALSTPFYHLRPYSQQTLQPLRSCDLIAIAPTTPCQPCRAICFGIANIQC